MNAHVVGGMQMLDKDEAEDKIVAVLENDLFWG
jgi:inorganic pyrophosphatase